MPRYNVMYLADFLHQFQDTARNIFTADLTTPMCIGLREMAYPTHDFDPLKLILPSELHIYAEDHCFDMPRCFHGLTTNHISFTSGSGTTHDCLVCPLDPNAYTPTPPCGFYVNVTDIVKRGGIDTAQYAVRVSQRSSDPLTPSSNFQYIPAPMLQQSQRFNELVEGNCEPAPIQIDINGLLSNGRPDNTPLEYSTPPGLDIITPMDVESPSDLPVLSQSAPSPPLSPISVPDSFKAEDTEEDSANGHDHCASDSTNGKLFPSRRTRRASALRNRTRICDVPNKGHFLADDTNRGRPRLKTRDTNSTLTQQRGVSLRRI